MPRREIGERPHTARGVGSGRAQQLRELMRRARIEATIGPACEARDLAKGLLRDRLVTFLEHESRNTEKPELARRLAKIIKLFFNCIADKNQRPHFAFQGFPPGVPYDPAYPAVVLRASD